MSSSTQTGRRDGASFDGPSFDDDVLTSALQQARILRALGYRAEAAHVDRFVTLQTPVEEAPVA